MRRTNTAFYEGFVSSFFLQPSKFRKKTKHTDFESMNVGSVQQDWLLVGGDFNRASNKALQNLTISQQNQLNRVRYRYESEKS